MGRIRQYIDEFKESRAKELKAILAEPRGTCGQAACVASDFGHDPFTWLSECAQTAKYALECGRAFHALVRTASSSAILCRRRRRLVSSAGFAPPGCRTPFVDSVPDCAVAPGPRLPIPNEETNYLRLTSWNCAYSRKPPAREHRVAFLILITLD